MIKFYLYGFIVQVLCALINLPFVLEGYTPSVIALIVCLGSAGVTFYAATLERKRLSLTKRAQCTVAALLKD
jgi:hypothetical protein